MKASGQQTISDGDIGIVEDKRVRYPFWKLGIVEQVIPGRDGHVQGASVRIGTTERSGHKLLRRPVQHLYPFEIGMNKEVVPTDPMGRIP